MTPRGWVALAAVFLLSLPGCGPGGTDAPNDHSEHEGHEEHSEHAEHEEGHQEVATIALETQQALGLTIEAAEVRQLERRLEVTGQIAQDTERLVHVHPPQVGVLTKLLVNVGDRVEQGAVIAQVTTKDHPGPVDVTTPRAGLVIGMPVSPGSPVDTLTSLATVADLGQVSATFDLYEQDIGVVAIGQRIEASSVAYPGRVFTGKIVFVSPQVDQHTRTIKIRGQLDNPDYALKLGMFVTGAILIPTTEQTLAVPRVSVQRLEDTEVVFVQTAPDAFQVRPVQLGHAAGEHVQVLEGLQPGEPVVTVGSFHLKAELMKGTLEEGHAH